MKFELIICTILLVASENVVVAQQTGKPSATANATPAIPDSATEAQVREYLRVSGDADEFRKSWIAAVDKNYSKAEPYWPDSFLEAVKDEMKRTDLTPMYITLFQRGVSRKLMQEVLDAYRERGREHFTGSPECLKLGAAMNANRGEYERLKLAETQAVFSKIYAKYKPQIKAARARYLAEHPDWKDK